MKTDCMSGFSHSANCDLPIQPPNGYVLPYSSTVKGAMVSVLCWNYDQQSIRKEGNLTCSYHGVWEPNPREVCGTTNSDSAVTGTDNNTVSIITFKIQALSTCLHDERYQYQIIVKLFSL